MEVGTTDFRRNAWIGNLILDGWPKGVGGLGGKDGEQYDGEEQSSRRKMESCTCNSGPTANTEMR